MQFPGPVRAAVGLLANAAEEAKHLPDRAIELPMLAVSTALQVSLRAQQRYARLAARGDEVLNRRRPTDDPPAWATFDDPVPVEQLPTRPDDRARAASDLLDELLGGESPASNGRPPAKPERPWASAAEATADATITPAKKAPARKAPPPSAPARSAPAKKAAAKKTEPAATNTDPAATNTDPAADEGDPADKGKTVSKPRHTPPSRFDAVDDE
jgi:hypothetical protein